MSKRAHQQHKKISQYNHHSFNTRPEIDFEVIPDSEEERQQHQAAQLGGGLGKVIEISDVSEEEDFIQKPSCRKPAVVPIQTPKKAGNRPHYSKARIIESSDDNSEPDIIELSDSSISSEVILTTTRITASKVRSQPQAASLSPSQSDVDDSIIIFDEPDAKNPLRIGTKKNNSSDGHKNTVGVAQTYKIGEGTSKLETYLRAPVKNTISMVTQRQSDKRPRANSKKAQLAEEQRRRYGYAQQLFTDLNVLVFNNGLPHETKLNWNKRLLTTAGRAKFHRSKEGVQTTEIELAEKILDCEERIRNTLSHEMCHLATWVIDNKTNEHHGELFKNWASRVMKKRPDIHVSIKHDYEINHPFQWKCEKCTKVYGRFSKSIRPDECVCGACKEGTLIPLFQTRAPSKKPTKKLSRMAAAKPQDSPRARKGTFKDQTPCEGSDTESSDIDAMTAIFASTSIGPKTSV